MTKTLLLLISILVQQLVFAQPVGMEEYQTFQGDTIAKMGVRTLLLKGQDSTHIYWYINEISEEGIGKTIQELQKLLDENGVDPMQPTTIESSFPEHIDNFDAQAISKYLAKKSKDFSFGYLLKDKNNGNEQMWLLNYTVNSSSASLTCVRWLTVVETE